jgi:hypothetical protein
MFAWRQSICLAGGGGIGFTRITFFGSLQYYKAGTVVAFIVAADFSSAKLRQALVLSAVYFLHQVSLGYPYAHVHHHGFRGQRPWQPA